MALIHTYCIQGKTKEVADLLNRDKSCVNSVLDAEYTPLLCAVTKGWSDIVKILFQYNTNIYAQNKLGNNCLHIAVMNVAGKLARSEKREAFYLIIEMILDKEIELRRGLTAVQYAPLLETINNLGLKPLEGIPEDSDERQRILKIIEQYSRVTDPTEPDASNHLRLRHRDLAPLSEPTASHPQERLSGSKIVQKGIGYSVVATLLSLPGYLFNKVGQRTPRSEETKPLLDADSINSKEKVS